MVGESKTTPSLLERSCLKAAQRLSRSVSNAGRLICRWPRVMHAEMRRRAGDVQSIVLLRCDLDESYCVEGEQTPAVSVQGGRPVILSQQVNKLT